MPSAAAVAAARNKLRLGTEAIDLKEGKENERPAKRQKGGPDETAPAVLLMAGGDGPHVGQPVTQPIPADEEDQFEDSFLDAPDLDLTQFVTQQKSHYFPDDSNDQKTDPQ